MSKKNSISSNSSDKEIDYLEEEFLKCSPDDLPVPKKEIEDSNYNYQVLEVMKTGCNRQIAEYAMLEYIKLEDEEKKEKGENFKKLGDLRKTFFDKLGTMLEKNKDANEINGKEEEVNEYEGDIDEYCYNHKEKDKNEIKKFLKKILSKKEKYKEVQETKEAKEDKEAQEAKEAKEFVDEMDKYHKKREAVIEAALRKVKKIVNDKDEYAKFFEGYYGKKYVEDNE